MFVRNFGFGLLIFWVAVMGGGCKKSEPAAPQGQQAKSAPNAQPLASAGDAIARVHWLGKDRVSKDLDAAYFMTIWDMPESRRLEAQTLDKLALAPWIDSVTNHTEDTTNYDAIVAAHPGASLLRPLVLDVLENETYLEVRQGSNQPSELALAVRMNETNAATWQSNLAGVVELLTGAKPSPAAGAYGWRVDTGHPDARGWSSVSLTRAGEWTVVGIGGAGATNGPTLVADFAARIQSSQAPFARSGTNYWIDADVDLLKLTRELKLDWFSWASKAFSQPVTNLNLPRAMITFIGDGQNVRTRAELEFPQELGLELDAWNVPTNLIHDPLIGFTAIRGLRSTLKAFKPWNDLQLGTPPNQAYFWAQRGFPQFHFMVAPSAEACKQVDQLEDFILRELNPVFLSNPLRVGGFIKVDNSHRISWKGMPMFVPSIDCLTSDGTSLIFAGFVTNQPASQPMPLGLMEQVYGPTNLVIYDWELTGSCVQGLSPMFQLTRRAFGRPRLPADPIGAWLNAVPSKLGNSATAAHLTGPTRLLVNRKSTTGFTGAEIQLFLDWLQSPDFPCGLHTFRAENPAPPPPPPPQR